MSTERNRIRARGVLDNNDLYELLDEWDTSLLSCDKERNTTDFKVGRVGVNVSVDCHPDSDDVVYLERDLDNALVSLMHGAQDYVCLEFDDNRYELWIRGTTKWFLAADSIF